MSIIHTSPLPDVEIPDVSITDYVLRFADDGGLADQVAITDGGETSYTFSELRSAVQSVAGGLAARGIGPGSTVAVMTLNSPEYAVVFHAVATAGGTVTTINPTYGPDEVCYQLQDANASMVITSPAFLDTARAGAEGTAVAELVVMDRELYGEPISQVPVDFADHVVALPYSSGTTGLPKGVMLTHRNLVANICQTRHVWHFEPGEVALAFLPFFHIYGMQILMNVSLANGLRVITMPRFDLAEALALVEREKVTRFFAVPPIVLGLARSPEVDNYDLSSLRMVMSGAAPLGADLAEEAATRVGCEFNQAYGMTELSPVSHCTPEGEFRRGTSGVTVSNTELRVVDPETGQDQPVGERGELWVRGPQVMKGYLNNEAATSMTIDDDGWLHTGDVGIVDEHHHVTIVDRIKELIKYKGFQVPPAELEALIVTHPKVADVAVIGIDDPEAGEVPKAFVVPTPGETTDLAEIQAFVGEHVASYKQIRAMELVESIPKSASGKILRRELRARR